MKPAPYFYSHDDALAELIAADGRMNASERAACLRRPVSEILNKIFSLGRPVREDDEDWVVHVVRRPSIAEPSS